MEENIVPVIQEKLIRRECCFINQMYAPIWFVVHFTGGTPNLESLYNYWNSSCVSSHFGIERYDNEYAKAGDIWQFVRLTDGSGANCCLEEGAAPFLPGGVNLNVRTITVECINPNSSNEGLMPQAQYDSLVWLIRDVCTRMGISTTKYTEYTNQFGMNFTFGDAGGGVIMHRDICPINRQRCPGMEVYLNQMKNVMRDVNSGVAGGRIFVPATDVNGWVVRSWNVFYDIRNAGQPQDQQLPIPRRDTGIFNKWKSLLLDQNISLGGVLTEEIQWNNDEIVQYFEAGQIWYNKKTGQYNCITGGGLK
jgi:hypothetical protein